MQPRTIENVVIATENLTLHFIHFYLKNRMWQVANLWGSQTLGYSEKCNIDMTL